MALGVRHHIERQHLDHVVDAATVRDQAAVHVSLADRERRVEDKAADGPFIANRDSCFRPGSRRAGVGGSLAVRPAHGKPADGDELPHDGVKGSPHRSDPHRRN